MGIASTPWVNMDLNLPRNSDSDGQRQILDALPVLVFLERAGSIVFANAQARQMLGLADEEWTPRPIEDVLWGLFAGTAEPLTLLAGPGESAPFHATVAVKGGGLLPVEGTYSLLNADEREAVIVAYAGGREPAPKSHMMEDVLSSIPEAVVIVHSNHVLYSNPAFTRMFGYTPDETSGSNLRDLIVPEGRRQEHATLETAVDRNGCSSLETVRVNKAGELVDVSMLGSPLLVEGAKVGHVFSFRRIVSPGRTEPSIA